MLVLVEQVPVALVVDPPELFLALGELVGGVHQTLQKPLDILQRERQRLLGYLQAELLVDLVAANLREIVALGVEEQPVHEVLRVLYVHRLAGTLTPEDLQQRVLARGGVVALQGIAHQPGVAETVHKLLGAAHVERLQKHRHRQLALAVDAHGDVALVLDLELQPRPARRHQAGGEDLLGRILGLHDVRARRAHELRHHDALGAVDDEGPRVGHERELAHEHVLLAKLARLLDDETDLHEQRRRVGLVLGDAVLDGELRLLEVGLPELHRVRAREILYRGDLAQSLRDPLVHELLK